MSSSAPVRATIASRPRRTVAGEPDHRVREHVVEQSPVAGREPLDEPVVGRRKRAGMAAPQVHERLLQRGEESPALVVRLGRERR